MARRRIVSEVLYQWGDEGDIFTGKLIAKGEQQFIRDNGTINHAGRFTFQVGDVVYLVNGTSQLDRAMVAVTVGEEVEITYKGDLVLDSGFKVKQFEVAVLEDDKESA